jgi:hypothetical protein
MEELDFSEEACIERFVNFTYFEEDTEDALHIDGIRDDDPIINGLHIYGRIAADWDIYESRKPAADEEALSQPKMAA